MEHHPMWMEARQALSARGVLDDVREGVKAAYEQANESSEAFAVTSRYLISEVTVAARPKA